MKLPQRHQLDRMTYQAREAKHEVERFRRDLQIAQNRIAELEGGIQGIHDACHYELGRELRNGTTLRELAIRVKRVCTKLVPPTE